jgi:gliding motility-associated-like protein
MGPILYSVFQRLHCLLQQRLVWLLLFLSCLHTLASAQECPPNIDFETGGFNGWRCWVGHVASVSGVNVISLNEVSYAIDDRHTMLTSFPGNGKDPFGDFPMNCPNGSGHSIKLGNTSGGNEAEGVSYDFVVPKDRDVYSLIYHYAVVFQDPNHLESEQPRMEVEITNVTDNQIIQCSSFTFYPYGSPLPGFQLSANPGSNTPVWFKDWSAVTINLNNMAGKQIRLFFKTADCTFRRHFGYAYVDVNSECSGEFTGAAYCPDDTAVTVEAPYGYAEYKWLDASLSNVIGQGAKLRLSPPPPPGTRIAVELIPYDGYGCYDTLFAKLVDTLTVNAHAGPDNRSCNRSPVQIGGPPKPGIVYKWSPAKGLSDPNISNPLATPDVTTTYIVKASSSGGGCISYDTVVVKAEVVDDSLRVLGKTAWCITDHDSSVLLVQPNYHIQWYRNNIPVLSESDKNIYPVKESGTYYATISSLQGCSVTTRKQDILIDQPRKGQHYPDKFAVANLSLDLSARDFGKRYRWAPATELDNDTLMKPHFKGAQEALYTVSIIAASGCITTDTQSVKIVNHIEVYVPNAFTPNKDGQNDILRPLLRGLKQLNYFKIFDRWGKVLFQTNKEYEGWDGLIGGHIPSTDTVVWVVEAVGADDKVYKKTGTTIIIR